MTADSEGRGPEPSACLVAIGGRDSWRPHSGRRESRNQVYCLGALPKSLDPWTISKNLLPVKSSQTITLFFVYSKTRTPAGHHLSVSLGGIGALISGFVYSLLLKRPPHSLLYPEWRKGTG